MAWNSFLLYDGTERFLFEEVNFNRLEHSNGANRGLN